MSNDTPSWSRWTRTLALLLLVVRLGVSLPLAVRGVWRSFKWNAHRQKVFCEMLCAFRDAKLRLFVTGEPIDCADARFRIIVRVFDQGLRAYTRYVRKVTRIQLTPTAPPLTVRTRMIDETRCAAIAFDLRARAPP